MTPTPPDFEAMYAADPDPWQVATSWYEQRKLGLVLAALRRPSYRLAWDAASGTGELAARIAARCGRVVATDASARAVQLTRRRVADAGALNVMVERSALPQRPQALAAPVAGVGPGVWTKGSGAILAPVRPAEPAQPAQPAERAEPPDLIVLSEVLYYLDAAQRAETWALIASLAEPLTDVVAVHWRPRPDDGSASGEAVQRELNDALVDAGWCRVVTHTDVEFVMACWSQDVPETLGR